MSSPQSTRNTRLKNDYKEMCNIRGSIVTWRAVRGTPPFVESYHLTVNVRSIIGPGPNYRDQHLISVDIPADYPNAPPRIVMLSQPVVFHPNWWPSDHRWCYGTWVFSETLSRHIIRMMRTLQFDPIITNERSPANHDAEEWYIANLNRGIFPSDHQVLPDPSRPRLVAAPAMKKKFEIRH
jgi:ubiquitin-protein ligase